MRIELHDLRSESRSLLLIEGDQADPDVAGVEVGEGGTDPTIELVCRPVLRGRNGDGELDLDTFSACRNGSDEAEIPEGVEKEWIFHPGEELFDLASRV